MQMKRKFTDSETSLQYQIIPEWDIKAAYTFTESEITKGEDKGYALESTAKHLLNLTSTWHINDVFDIWLQHEYPIWWPSLYCQTNI